MYQSTKQFKCIELNLSEIYMQQEYKIKNDCVKLNELNTHFLTLRFFFYLFVFDFVRFVGVQVMFTVWTEKKLHRIQAEFVNVRLSMAIFNMCIISRLKNDEMIKNNRRSFTQAVV